MSETVRVMLSSAAPAPRASSTVLAVSEAAVLQAFGGFTGALLETLDQALDLGGGLLCALGEAADLVDHREAASGVAGACRLMAALSASRLVCSVTDPDHVEDAADLLAVVLQAPWLRWKRHFGSQALDEVTAWSTTASPWRALHRPGERPGRPARRCARRPARWRPSGAWRWRPGRVSTFWLLTPPARVCSVTESSSAELANWLTPSPIRPTARAGCHPCAA